MIKAMLGKKIGMTQIYTKEGVLVPVTIIEVGPCCVLQVKNKQTHGYSAVQIGFGDVKESSLTKPVLGYFKKNKLTPKKVIKEIRADGIEGLKPGANIELDFQEGSFVDITGTSIGKGFQGGVKRWGWRGGKSGHGSMHHRTVGSLSASSFPSRIFKGTHMPGRMGGEKRTVQNLKVMKVDKENNLIAVQGAVPGHKNSILMVKEAKKKKAIKKPEPAGEQKEAAPKAAKKETKLKEKKEKK
jgi:large subunit ribosomal protein L3